MLEHTIPAETTFSLADQQWQTEETLCAVIYSQGLQAYTDDHIAHEDLIDAVQSKERTVVCVDEAVEGCLHVGGSFILLPLEAARTIVEDEKISGIYSHRDCGAMALVYRERNHLDAQTPIDPEVLDQFTKQATAELANALGIDYMGHLAGEDLHRPEGLHIARAVYYHSTPYFNPYKAEGLPKGFVVSRSILPPQEAVANVELSIGIALGKHGFGERFTIEDPLLLVVVADNYQELQQLKNELRSVVEKYEGRVKLENLVIAD